MIERTEIPVLIAGESVALSSSLHAGLRLARDPGFAVLARGIDELSLTTACRIVCACGIEARPTVRDLPQLRDPLLAFLLALTCRDDDAEPEPGPPQTYEEWFSDLYRKATGWLGWTPDAALASSPRQIIEAMRGHIEMLRAQSGEIDPETERREHAWAEETVHSLKGRRKNGEQLTEYEERTWSAATDIFHRRAERQRRAEKR